MDMPIANPVRSIFDVPTHEHSVVVNIGPSHPATHGTVQLIVELDGERILRRLDLTARQAADLAAFLRSLSR